MVLERVQVRIRGTLLTSEEWSVNPNFIGNFDATPPTQQQLTDWVEDIATELTSGAYGGLMAALSSACTIDAIDAYSYGSTGRLERQATFMLATPYRGTGSFRLPPASAIVLSLGTGLPGRRRRGRLYWPALGLTLATAQAGIGVETTTALAQQMGNLLVGMEDAAPTGMAVRAAVYSGTGGDAAQVVQIRVGSQVDSQRRRRESLREDYSVFNLLGR